MHLEMLLFIVLLSAILLTGGLRMYAIKKNVIDVPNSRSSHSVPTPRGGGVSIVICFLGGLAYLAYNEVLSVNLLILFFVAGALVALIGWLDDHGHVNARWRLLIHFSSAALIVFVTGGLPTLSFFGFDINFGWLGFLLSTFTLVWLLNLYNFMDGIDGLAGSQAVISSAVVGGLLVFLLDKPAEASIHFLMAVSALGFLVWNFPPAKIFMGDAGSGFVGLMLGSLMLLSAQVDQVLLWAWLIMLGVFIVDATMTLLIRLLRGDKIYEAHRSHAYQFASRQYGNHRIVTLAVICINLFWLAPLAYLASSGLLDGFLTLLIAYIPLVFLANKYKAGELEISTL